MTPKHPVDSQESNESRFSWTPLSPTLGAEVHGCDLTERLSDRDMHWLNALFDDRSLLVFRGQQLTAEQQIRAVGHIETVVDNIGNGTFHAFVSNRLPDATVPWGRLLFHSDLMFMDEPRTLLSLYGLDVHSDVEPTLFASTVDAYQRLPQDLQDRVQTLTALNIGDASYDRTSVDHADLVHVVFEHPQSCVRDVVTPHRRTRKPVLTVSESHTAEIVGYDQEHSELLLTQLFDHLYDPAHCYQHRWQAGDLLIWDNLALQHGRPNVTTSGPVRTLRRVVCGGTVGTGPAGRGSYA